MTENKGNFNISETWGTLIIIPHELTVSTEGGSWTYDGEWHDNKASFTHSELPETFTFEFAKEYGVDLDLYFGPVDKEFVSLCHLNNIKVNVWTVDDLNDANNLVEMGVDYITSNIIE